jgi:hypothetical protein
MANQESQKSPGDDLGQDLSQALMRLTSPHYENLACQIDTLQVTLKNLGEQLAGRDDDLSQRDEELKNLIQEAQKELKELQVGLNTVNDSLQQEIFTQTQDFSQRLTTIQAELENPEEVAKRIRPVFLPVVSDQAREQKTEFAQAVSPVIGPAIRHQIRESKQDIIDSLYPIIGQIIGLAISESIRELTRNIDARMRQQLDLRSRLRYVSARLRGVSQAEMLLRESLPYTVQYIFLIHRPTGILLEHLSSLGEQVEDADILSGMLTAIRDFVRDSFGGELGELEEITHGDRRFLIESGNYAYLAVVVKGVEPSGYHALIDQTIHEINLKYELALRNFNGDLDSLPSFKENLEPLLEPEQGLIQLEAAPRSMSKAQKWFVVGVLAGILLLLGLVVFACVFTFRLWPLAFSG